jgi:hypothetical protein
VPRWTTKIGKYVFAANAASRTISHVMFTRARSFEDAMDDYQRTPGHTNLPADWRRWNRRGQTCSSCSARSTGNQKAMDGSVQLNAVTI